MFFLFSLTLSFDTPMHSRPTMHFNLATFQWGVCRMYIFGENPSFKNHSINFLFMNELDSRV